MIRLSIIIPVFNVEGYIGECIESCLHQDIPGNEYEIILVDDCSSDKSIEVAQQCYDTYQLKAKPEMKVILTGGATPNGAATARNIGLATAHGKYVWFIDSDDKIEENCISYLLDKAEQIGLDFIRFGYYLWTQGGIFVPYMTIDFESDSGWEIYKRFRRPGAVWSVLWKCDFLIRNKIKFLEGFIYEDEEFMPKTQYLAGKSMMLSKQFYYYRQREGSVMKSKMTSHKVLSYLAVCESLRGFQVKNVKKQDYFIFDNIIAFLFSQGLSINSLCKTPVSLDMFKKSICYPLNAKSIKYRIINISLYLAMFLFRIKHIIMREKNND